MNHINNYPIIFKKTVVHYYNKSNVQVKDILDIFNISNGSLYNWINKNKVNGLTDKKQYTKTSKYLPYIKCYIRNYVLTKHTFDMTKLLCLLKRKYSIIANKSSVYEIIKHFNITRKRIKQKFIYGKKSKHTIKINKFKKQIDKINKDDIISIDESSIDTHINNLYEWGLKGSKIVNVVNTIRKRYTLICAISNNIIIHYKVICGSSNAILFKTFLEELSAKGITNKYLLLDNARIHKQYLYLAKNKIYFICHAKIVKEYVDSTSNKLVFNVPYSPEYNPIEMIFSKLKASIRKKSNNKNANGLLNNIRISINKIKQIDLENCYRKALTFD